MKRSFISKAIIASVAVILTASFGILTLPKDSRAAGADDFHIRIDVSSDGTHWYNYAGTEYSGHHTLTVSPGDTVHTRIQIWNTAVAPADIVGAGDIANASYIHSFNDVDLDADNNANSFVANYFTGTGAVQDVALGHTEIMTADLKLDSDFPEGTTYITGIVGVSAPLPQGQDTNNQDSPLSWITPAHAQVITNVKTSTFRIAVTNETVEDTLPQTGAN